MRIKVNNSCIPCEMQSFVSHPESRFFGWYLVSLGEEEFLRAKGSAPDPLGIGYSLEVVEGRMKALVKPEFVVLDDE